MRSSMIIEGAAAVRERTIKSMTRRATLALTTGLTMAASPALSWENMNRTDPLDDSVTTYVFVWSDSTSACSDQRPALSLLCSENTPSSLFLAGACEPLTDAGEPFAPFEVTVRVDTSPAVWPAAGFVDTSPAVKVTMRRNLFAPELIGDMAVGGSVGDAPKPEFGDMIQDYLDSQKIAVRYITADGSVETLVFSTVGMREAVMSSGSVCDADMFQ